MTSFFEHRTHPRFVADNIMAKIAVKPPPPNKEFIVDGKLIDMSYTGIKIKLKYPLPSYINYSEIKIVIIMPKSGIPISIQGIIRYCNEQNEYGLQFSDQADEQTVDKLVFECIKRKRKSIPSSDLDY